MIKQKRNTKVEAKRIYDMLLKNTNNEYEKANARQMLYELSFKDKKLYKELKKLKVWYLIFK